MPKITFVDSKGNEQPLDAPSGISLMEAAIKNGISGIEADCGGACSCATCHVFIGLDWQAKMPEKQDMEDAMLEFALDMRDTSRLSCQVLLTDALDGMTVELPSSQT
ncbi:MAG: 2Fe-2S iron-sulfur cluster binding domain-containing protein [Sphingomonadales bacterium]|nr:MAG: 2Fe-2S iron-sulfur cluster binding domain-containing protein [Sphingomonadales bacterium]